jgi:hypothetical protein
MSTQTSPRFVFAFSKYDDNHTPHYFGVREDGSIYHSTDWNAFYKVVGHYCERIELQCGASYRKDADQAVYASRYYLRPFVFVLSNAYLAWLDAPNASKPSIESTYKAVDFIPASDISYCSEEIDPETSYYAAVATCLERD